MQGIRTNVLAVAALAVGLAGCGGGGGGGGGSTTSLSVQPASLAFVSTDGSIPPPKVVQAFYQGDGLLIGYAPDVSPPSWLEIQEDASGPGSASFTFRVNDVVTGTRSTSVRFLTGRSDGSDLKYVDLPVSYTVTLPFNATAQSMEFSAINRSGQPAQPTSGYSIQIEGTNARWRVQADRDWVVLDRTSGSGPGGVNVTADASRGPLGVDTAQITVTDDDSGQTRTFGASLHNRAARLVVTASSAQFTVNSSTTTVSQAMTVTDELGSSQASEAVSWSLQSIDQPWVKWSPGSGTSVPAVAAALTLDLDELATMPAGTYSATVTLSYDNAEASGQTLSIPVSLTLTLPTVRFVAPYVGLANTAGALTLRGERFDDAGSQAYVRVGDTEIGPLVPDSSTQLRLSYPALPAGNYTVAVKNGLGIVRSHAELVVIEPPVLAYHAISAPSPRRRLIWDAERSELYGINRQDQQIERYSFGSGGWGALSPLVLPNLTDAALAPNGRLLTVLTRGDIYEADLTTAPLAATQRVTNPDPFCGSYFDRAAMANNGKAFVTFNYANCSGFTPSWLYDISTRSLTSNAYFQGYLYNGIVDGSADGSRIYAGSNGVSPAQKVIIFDALSNGITTSSAAYNLNRVSVSGDASRVLLQGSEVYSRSLTLLGHIPLASNATTIVSTDARRAFAYYDSPARVEVFDLTAPLVSGANYPLLRTINLADAASSTPQGYTATALALTPDDRTLFVSGNARILVVPVGE